MQEERQGTEDKQESSALGKAAKIVDWVGTVSWVLVTPFFVMGLWYPESLRSLIDRLGPAFMIALIVLYSCFSVSFLVAVAFGLIRLVHWLRHERGKQEKA